jgi:DNA (cytosine-5)-methyltransferase 1
MAAYYNDNDAFCVAWLRNLIFMDHLPPGDVDERDIADVSPVDLWGYSQAHFFAGIGGWGLAQRLAGWPDDQELWTGSCPCQPFSNAGRRRGTDDARHLWPVWHQLIRSCRPHVVMGEQVAAPLGVQWLDDVLNDLEADNYAVGAMVVPACAVGAPHRRDRLWFVADGQSIGRQDWHGQPVRSAPEQPQRYGSGAMADTDGARLAIGSQPADGSGAVRQQGSAAGARGAWSDAIRIANRLVEPGIRLLADGGSNRVSVLRALGNAIVPQVAADVMRAWLECAP